MYADFEIIYKKNIEYKVYINEGIKQISVYLTIHIFKFSKNLFGVCWVFFKNTH